MNVSSIGKVFDKSTYPTAKLCILLLIIVRVLLDVQCCCFLKTLGQTLMVQVAKRGASVLKRRKSRNRMEPPSSTSGAAAASSSTNNDGPPPRSESDGDVVFYVEEPRAGKLLHN